MAAPAVVLPVEHDAATTAPLADLDVSEISSPEACYILKTLQPSKLIVTLADTLKPIPAPETLTFGKVKN